MGQINGGERFEPRSFPHLARRSTRHQAPKIKHSSVYLLVLLDQPLGAPDRLERPDRVHQIEDLRESAGHRHDREQPCAGRGLLNRRFDPNSVLVFILAAQDCNVYEAIARRSYPSPAPTNATDTPDNSRAPKTYIISLLMSGIAEASRASSS